MARTDYTVEIVECTKELTHKEEVQLKDLTYCQSLNEIVQQEAIVIKPVMVAALKVHNEHSKDNKDYMVYVIADENGDRYKTGSESFYSTICDIITDMGDSDEEWEINIYTRQSKNHSGKNFITCSIV